MKTLSLKIFFVVMLMAAVSPRMVRAEGDEPAAAKPKGFFASQRDPYNVLGPYIELGPTFFVPVVNNKFGSTNADLFQALPTEMSPGGGFQLGVGFDTKWAGLGTKGRWEFFNQKDFVTGDSIAGMAIQWDILELKLYVLDWFRAEPSRFRPYLIGSGGMYYNSVTLFGGRVSGGGGLQYQLSKHFYVGGEVTYQLLGFTDETVHAIGTAGTIGYRF